MVTPVFSHNNFFVASFKKCTHNTNALCASQAALGVLTVLSAGVSLEGWISHSFSYWIYPTSYATFALSLLGIGATLACKPLVSAACNPPVVAPQEVPLLSLEEIASLNSTSLVHELCEMHPDGKHKPCTIERLEEIVIQLEHKALNGLNTIPEYYLSKPRSLLPLPSTFYTPLQYWASQGNLPAVKFLIQHGAVDYPTPSEDILNSSEMTSALYTATMAGHVPIVSYLLRQGAQPTIAFNQNLLASFVPKLIFELCLKISFRPLITPERQAPFEGLRQVLQHLSLHQPSNLQLQLKIPIYPEKNSLDWVETLYPQSPEREQLLQILTEFGGVKNNVISNDELTTHGKIGAGFTLQEIFSFKD